MHWMWWPVAGAIVVGLVGWVEPRTLGVGYGNITGALAGTIAGRALLILVVLKLISWAVYLGSGTSGGTLAPLFTIGGGLGAWLGAAAGGAFPTIGIDPRMAGLVGMAAIFAGATHALLASIVFAFGTTRQPVGLLPLLAGCAAAYLVSLLCSRHSIMTEKLARRGVSVRTEYAVDHLAHVLVRDAMTRDVVTPRTTDTVGAVLDWLVAPERTPAPVAGAASSHHGFPVLDREGGLAGVLTRRDLYGASTHRERTLDTLLRRGPVAVFEHSTLRDAADQMVTEHVGRLPVVSRDRPRLVVGIVARSDLLAAHTPRLRADRHRTIRRALGRAGHEPG